MSTSNSASMCIVYKAVGKSVACNMMFSFPVTICMLCQISKEFSKKAITIFNLIQLIDVMLITLQFMNLA